MGNFSWLLGGGKKKAPPRGTQQFTADELKTNLAIVLNDARLQDSAVSRVQPLVPLLSTEQTRKLCLGMMVKLVSAIMASHMRDSWEKNINAMCLNSFPGKFTADDAAAACRLAENTLRKHFGWSIEILDPKEPELTTVAYMNAVGDDKIFIEAGGGGIFWILSRGDDRLAVIGPMLATSFLMVQRVGWSAGGLQPETRQTTGLISVKLLPCVVSDQAAREMMQKIRTIFGPRKDDQMYSFIDRGGFRIDRAPDSLPRPANKSAVCWKIEV